MNILLAEDDRNFGFVLKEELEEMHHHVDLVGDGVEAVLSYMEHPYDLLLFDIRMPRLSGTDTMRIIKKINQDVPVIIISGSAGAKELSDSLSAGACSCLAKPFAMERLVRLIEQCDRTPPPDEKGDGPSHSHLAN
ncbi:MAG: response regulator [Acidobacteria bacterium]|nr:response regulator [Acidobacteriota bacterium]